MAASANGRRWNVVAWLAHVLAAAVAFSFAFTPLRSSTDEFWHLKAGRWIWENGQLPENDIFTYTAAHLPWHNHEWLTQIGMWHAYRLGEATGWGGWPMVILVKALFIVGAFAGFGLLLSRRLVDPAWGALAAALAAALGRRTFYPRPPFVTYLLMALQLWLLVEWRAGRVRGRWLWVLPPIFAFWANLHGGWMAGLVVLGAFWADGVWQWLAARLAGAPTADIRRRLAHLTMLGGACVLGTLCNPYGWHLYALPGRVMGDAYLASVIGEMAPPTWGFVWVLPGVLLTLAAVGLRPAGRRGWVGSLLLLAILAGVLLAASDVPFGREGAQVHPFIQWLAVVPFLLLAALRAGPGGWPAHFLLLAFFGWQGLAHVRHLPLLALVALPTLACGLDRWATANAGVTLRPAAVRAVAPLVLAVLAGGWLFGPGESFFILPERGGPSYFDRNMMVLRGEAFQPVVHVRTTPPPAPTTLSARGAFLIQPYPVAAVDFLLRADLPGRLWNGGNYAGYLIWRLAPEHMRVFTDNRYDVFGGLVIRDEHSVLNGYEEEDFAWLRENRPDEAARWRPWRAVLDDWEAETLLIPVSAPVNAKLYADDNWVRVYEDLEWAIWVHNTPANLEAIERALAMQYSRTPWLRR